MKTRHSIFRIFFSLLCLLMVGCSLLPNEMKLAERIMETNPDSALYILQHIHPSQSLTDADRALYGILLFQALDKNNQPLQPDSVITFSVRHYENTNDEAHLAIGYYYKARLYKRAQQFEEATLLYLKVLDLSQNNKDYFLLGEIYSDLGDICTLQKDFSESLKKYQLAIDYFNQAGDTIEASYKIIDVGRIYRLLNEYKKAQLYYTRALSLTSDSMLQGDVYQEIGINYYQALRHDSAQYFLRKSLHYPYKGTSPTIRNSYMADMFLSTNQYDSAFLYATKALKYPSTYFNQRDCYRILANTEYNRGDFKQMAFYMSKYQDCTDSVRKIEIQTKSSILQNLHETKGAFSKSKQFLFVLGGVILAIVLLSFFIVNQLRNRNKKKEKQLEQAEVKLTEKQFILKDSLIQKIKENKTLQATAYKKATLIQRELIDKEIYNICLQSSDWEAFKKLMNQTFNSLISRLEKSYPEMNHKEMIWCCLFLLNVPNLDMTLVLDCQPGSLYKLKQRITQKMNLTRTKDLELLLHNLSEDK